MNMSDVMFVWGKDGKRRVIYNGREYVVGNVKVKKGGD